MKERLEGFDLIRTFAILTVFLGHILNTQCHNDTVLLLIRVLSPGLTMSLLGFTSGYLLSCKYKFSFGISFYIKRITRIYLSLFLCLSVISCLCLYLGKDVVNQHSILHFAGLSLFFEIFNVASKSPLGGGLWFITVIMTMYFLLPALTSILAHKNGYVHLVLLIVCSTFLNFFMYGTQSSFNVIISFSIGVYVGVNGRLAEILDKKLLLFVVGTLGVLIMCALATERVLPYGIRQLLFPFYPILVAPLLIRLTNFIPACLKTSIALFSAFSFEVYLLHGYFINKNLEELFPQISNLYMQIAISFAITLPLAFVCFKLASFASKTVVNYLLGDDSREF